MTHPAPAAELSEPQPILDLEHLRSFTDGDPQLEGELLTLYLSTADIYLAKMADALAAGKSWTATAHALKGASGNLGARRVMAQALSAEHATASAEHLQALHAALDEVRALVMTMPTWRDAQGA